ncbi:MAG: hypothetical protein K8S55_09580 [Phycisphaerae bacterium]|nr:hypothetical protein [Phycisphaerae bacterium]
MDSRNEQSERLDRMLRQWGTAEATGKVDVPPMPERSRRTTRPAMRWWSISAAIAAALVVGISLYMYQDGLADDRVNEAVTQREREHQVRIKRLQRDIETLRAESAGQVCRLEAELTKAKADAADELQYQLGEKQKINEALAAKFKAMKQKLARPDMVRKHKKALAGMASELERTRRMQQKQAGELKTLRSELDKARTQNTVIARRMRAIYIGSDKTGIAALQDVLRRNRLLRRCGPLRRKMAVRQDQLVMDKVEAVLTKLVLLDARDVSAAVAFRRMVARSKLRGQIDVLAASPRSSEALRTWLTEVNLILAGVENAC